MTSYKRNEQTHQPINCLYLHFHVVYRYLSCLLVSHAILLDSLSFSLKKTEVHSKYLLLVHPVCHTQYTELWSRLEFSAILYLTLLLNVGIVCAFKGISLKPAGSLMQTANSHSFFESHQTKVQVTAKYIYASNIHSFIHATY